jgi:hypothetical protein
VNQKKEMPYAVGDAGDQAGISNLSATACATTVFWHHYYYTN